MSCFIGILRMRRRLARHDAWRGPASASRSTSSSRVRWGAIPYLYCSEAVDEGSVAGRFAAGAHVACEAPHGREGFGHAEYVRGHGTHVPGGAVRRLAPVAIVQRPKHPHHARGFRLRHRRGFRPLQVRYLFDARYLHHRLPLLVLVLVWLLAVRLCTWLKNISTASSSRCSHRLPPGSLEICWSASPVPRAVNRSRLS